MSCRSYNTSTLFVSLDPLICLFCLLCFPFQSLTPSRRHVIRPAAKWSGASHNIQVVGHSSATSGVLTGDPGSAPSTSRESQASSSTVRPAIRTPVQSSTSQPQPDSASHTQSQPNSQQQDGMSVELHAFSSVQTPSTSTNAKSSATTSRAPEVLLQPQPSTSGLIQPQAGSSAHVTVEPQMRTSASAAHSSCTVASFSTKTQEKACTSTPSQDNPQASTSSAHSHKQTQSQPGTSMQSQSSETPTLKPHLMQVKEVKQVFVPQQPSGQASALITQPQLQLRPQNLLMQGNLIQIEPQPLAQAPAQAAFQAPQPLQVTPVIPLAVLIAAAPERLAPPEGGHRIILGSQAPGEAVPYTAPQTGASSMVPPTHILNVGLPHVNSNPHAPPVHTASVPSNIGDARLVLAPAPNPERVIPAPGLVAVPPEPEGIPQIEDARPGPSAPRETDEQQSLIRTLISGVVSIASEQEYRESIDWLTKS